MSKQVTLPKVYDFKSTEQRIYAWWEQNGFFKPSNDPNKPGFDPDIKPFVISIPPPNVTGILHIGHAMFVSIEDLMIRYHRMLSESTLWVPGTDHAGIATQLQVERLLRREGTSRQEIGREGFITRAWQWKEEHGGIIQNQIRRLGASCDWDRERFTLDEGLSRAVRESFVRLYEKGLIYRGERLINWSPGLQTAVSDLEVEYSEEPGKLYYFKYLLADNPEEYIAVATTRPETILGDTAVAVHPDDERYRRFVGRKVLVPILNRVIPIIADDYVDREFGTAALKVTPGHDPNDFEIGKRHGLEIISIMDKAAQMNANAGPYAGLDRFACRERLWEDMRLAGLVIKEDPYPLKVPRSQRGGEIIEPMVSTQWFVEIRPLAEAALDAVRDGRIRIIPDYFTKVYYNWMENIEDWCISRQLWWGHRIPVWYCAECGEVTVARTDPTQCAHCGSSRIEQDPDVLDTWFSSGLWPFSTLGWPDETPDFQYFYPTSVLETGYDILFFWVARMIMDGLEFTGEIPFHTVYLHGLIRDEHGHKMSKSKDNVIDPIEVMDELGTDALRFTLLVGSTPGKDTNLSVKRVEANRNFANKLWNAARFILGILPQVPTEAVAEPQWTLADEWIRARSQQVTAEVGRLFEEYQFGEAGRQLYEFFWSEFADWYLEIAKLQVSEGGDRAFYSASLLVRIMDDVLRMLHPFTPFITEELWGYLKQAAREHSETFTPQGGWEDALIVARWPHAEEPEEDGSIASFELIQEIVRSIRNVRAEKFVSHGQRIPAIMEVPAGQMKLVQGQAATIIALAHLDAAQFELASTLERKPEDALTLVVSGVQIHLPLAGLVDREAELERLARELATLETQIQRLEGLLGSEFASKAPPAVVQREREKLETYRDSASKIQEQLELLKG